MTGKYDYILAKHEDSGGMTLTQHLKDVADAAVVIARNVGLAPDSAFRGAVLHDIGKTSPLFQMSLKHGYVPQPCFVFRHEIASLLFISMFPENEWPTIIDMIVAHHKSIFQDVRKKGILDLDENMDCFARHAERFDEWSPVALGILSEFGIETHPISIEEARNNYEFVVDYCYDKPLNESEWKGLLMAADHFASALEDKLESNLDKLFIKPDLSFYNRQHHLYPLSMMPTDDNRNHTLVTAPTGAGKTDFLLRRCKGRVFYTLPFQASINAMYDRIKTDLKNTDAQVYLLHAASNLKMKDGKLEERIMQKHIGASVKVMTPHQMASIVFGIKGYEAMLLDLKGCDVILDEIHTYSSETQAIVLKIIEILKAIGCRIHVGTATMPSVLYDRILQLLGGKNEVYEVILPDDILKTFNRHIIHKVEQWDDCTAIIEKAVAEKQKVLIVCNQVKRSQQMFDSICKAFPSVEKMLIHSRFKRGDRSRLETDLKETFNRMTEACIVVSTQVVEVSLDISFDLMITECAPIDAMIQRFGRINRKRTDETIGTFKHIYVIQPPQTDKEALPYDAEVLKRSFKTLPDDNVIEESSVQTMIDMVYPEIPISSIDYSGAVYVDGQWQIKELCHYPKSALLDVLDINSAVCITEDDKDNYVNENAFNRAEMEIPASYRSIAHNGLEQIEEGSRPFVIPNGAYDDEMGLLIEYAKPEFFTKYEIL